MLDRHLPAHLRVANLLNSDDDIEVGHATNIGAIPGGADQQLAKMLTSDSGIPASEFQSRGDRSLRKIGAGACGALFAQDGESLAIKLAKANQHDLWNDYIKHIKIAEQFGMLNCDDVKIPACYYFVPDNVAQWFEERPNLVEIAQHVCNLPTSALVTERIWPLPQLTRSLLINKFCPKNIRDAAIADPTNMDCLVRPYLGSMHGKNTGMFFSLRNFKLHLNQMADLRLDVEDLARKMGTAMAIMHWAAKTDARDVEFVLGSSRDEKTPLTMRSEDLAKMQPFEYTGPCSFKDDEFFQRHTELWVLDFNQVRPINLDETGVSQAVEAVRLNDPYLPKPRKGSKIEMKVWNSFVLKYIAISDEILKKGGHGQEMLALPRMFLHGLVEKQRGSYVDMRTA